MTDSRAQTLASLDAFLDSQRQLLTRTQSDLHKLSQLRERALEQPEEFLDNIEEELDDPAFKLSHYDPPRRPQDIDWDLFTSLDPSPFANIPLPGPPPLSAAMKQRSAPSELQTFVREASKSILANFKPFIPSEEEVTVETESDAEDDLRLAELVKTGKNSSQPDAVIDLGIEESPLPRRRVGSGLRLKPSREIMDLEIGADASTKGKGKPNIQCTPVQTAPPSPPMLAQRPKRARRPTARPDEHYQVSSLLPPTSLPPSPLPEIDLPPLPEAVFGTDIPVPIGPENEKPELESTSSTASDEEPPQSRVKKKVKLQGTRRRKVSSETFNLPWSLSEQHLLEKLLEEIPAGEKQRWAKISKAMAGRRTARQVASRVQKYFEKLKKFGVNPD